MEFKYLVTMQIHNVLLIASAQQIPWDHSIISLQFLSPTFKETDTVLKTTQCGSAISLKYWNQTGEGLVDLWQISSW
jgi:hypothetical protein